MVPDFAAEAAALDRLPPRLVRARVEAELVRVVAITEVRSVAYSPGAQRLDAVVADAFGATATISTTHRVVCPGALDALADALASEPVFVSGTLRRVGGVLVIDPIGALTGEGLVLPDLAPVRGDVGRRATANRSPTRSARLWTRRWRYARRQPTGDCGTSHRVCECGSATWRRSCGGWGCTATPPRCRRSARS